jgi:protein SCO1/2
VHTIKRSAVRAFGCALLLPLALPLVLAGCNAKHTTPAPTPAAGEVKTFPIRGRIVSVDAAHGAIDLDHEAVPGFMDAMTMTYKLKDPSVASELHPGDRITAKILVHQTPDGFEDPMLDEIVVTAQARPDYKPSVSYHVPSAGDVVPDFKLINQSGRTIHLGQFKGRVLLLTFIYTRCPLADYCPRMSKNFAEIDKALAADPALYAKTHLLSVSFDPKYDTPAVLKSYGAMYAGSSAKEIFEHWDFAAPPEDEMAAMDQFFCVGVTPGDSGTLNHSMSTVLIGKDGKVTAWYPTNDWKTADVLAAMKSAAAA